MVQKLERNGENSANRITADVIILGCSLPGIVTAHKLMKTFGNSMNIVVLDLVGEKTVFSTVSVAFCDNPDDDDDQDDVEDSHFVHSLLKYTKRFNFQLPDDIFHTQATVENSLAKVFQFPNGQSASCTESLQDYSYLSFIERFELNQYQNLLNQSMIDLFQVANKYAVAEKRKLLYYDRTTMEEHICSALVFPVSREIMRVTVRLLCGVTSDSVSVLFYLHQCYRTSGGIHRDERKEKDMKLREKLLGQFRKRLAHKLHESIADIIVLAKRITDIRAYSDERVILETNRDTSYICNLLAMALKPDQLQDICVEAELVDEREVEIVRSMTTGRAKKFLIQYEENFWSRNGYSGDILSTRGPIIWAMERPMLSNTGSKARYASLVGYLKVTNDADNSSEAVIEQLVKLFGSEAANPIKYEETDLADIFVPRCGDYVAFREMATADHFNRIHWGPMDIFADGDVSAALEAGHLAYVNMVRCLRPQAQSYDDVSAVQYDTVIPDCALVRFMSRVNYLHTMRAVVYTVAIYVTVKFIRSHWRR